MKKERFLVLASLVFASGILLIGFAGRPADAAPQPSKWKYKVLAQDKIPTDRSVKDHTTRTTKGYEDALNKLGAQGWELVGQSDGMFVLKSPK